jgi:hypothetical protein
VTTIKVGPEPLDLVLYAGDGFAVTFLFVDKESGGPLPADGTWTAEVRAPAASPDVVIAFTVDASQQLQGKISLSLTGEEVRAILPVKGAEWDLQQQVSGSEPRTWYRGKVTVTQDVTRVGALSA